MKNYTSTVPVDRTVTEIQSLLIKAGAKSITMDYDTSGEIAALSFVILNPSTAMSIPVKLPANVAGAYKVLRKARKRFDGRTQKKDEEQAKRTAWRLTYDWVAVQLSMIEMEQAELLQVFLPYVWNGERQQSFYGLIKQQEFKALTYDPSPQEAEAES